MDGFRNRLPRRVVWTPGLNRFAFAHTLAGAADALVAVSLAGSLFFSLSPEASREQVLLYLLINMAPFALVAPLIGPAIDRFRLGHRWIAALLFALRAAFAAALAFTLLDLSMYFFALALLVAAKASGVVRQALVPGLVDEPGPARRRQLPPRPAERHRRRGRRWHRGGHPRAHADPGGDARHRLCDVPRRRRRHHPPAGAARRRDAPARRRVRGAARADHRRHRLGVHGRARRRRLLRLRPRLRPAP